LDDYPETILHLNKFYLMPIRKILLCAMLLFPAVHLRAGQPLVFKVDSMPSDGIDLDRFWKYHEGDDSLWATAAFNDAAWDTIDIIQWPVNKNAIHWYRLHLAIDTSLSGMPLALIIEQSGASEMYLDGVKLETYGKVAADKKDEEGYNPKVEPLIFRFSTGRDHVLAIRYSNHIVTARYENYGPEIQLSEANMGIKNVYGLAFGKTIMTDIILGFFAGLTFLHLLLYFFYRSDKNNLYYALFTGTFLLLLCSFHFFTYHTASAAWHTVRMILPVIYPLFFFVMFLLATRLFNRPPWWFYYLTIVITIVTILLYFINSEIYSYFLVSLVFNSSISILFTIRHAYRKKKDGVVILGTGLMLAAMFLIIMLTIMIVHGFTLQLSGSSTLIFISFLVLSILSIPVSMSVYLARNFAVKSKTLNIKLQEVEELSAKTILQAREKEDILSSQNERLENLVKVRTNEVTEQKNAIEKQKTMLETKNKEVLDSLHYARYLQQVILPPLSFINEKVSESFVLYKPKDIVAGDFYFAEAAGDCFFIAAADCTGHGVPGAMLSFLCSNALNQAIKEFGITDPAKILDKVNELVSQTFEKSRQNVNDGMDISLLVINSKEKKIRWAGAYNHLWYSAGATLNELKGNKQPIGKYQGRSSFTSYEIEWIDGSCFYLLTDGYADQFGGKDGKKFMRRQLFDLIATLYNKPASEQEKILDNEFHAWAGMHEQVDDVTIMGIRI
jgi:serine phosphatase RsbU (regulator of sigma subunit)